MTEKQGNSQAIHLLNQGYQIKTLSPITITPSQVEIPLLNKKYKNQVHQPIYIQNSLIETKTTTCRTLDGFALLESSGLGFPEDCRKIILTGQGYNTVINEDLLFFTGLVYLDVSDNLLNFHYFEELPRLKELRIVCNNIDLIGDIQGYHNLQILDISYNKLTTESILSLAYIPNLKELDLSGNNLISLPTHMSLFSSLERLILEHNKFSDNEIFVELSTLPTLRELDLAFNHLSIIPPSCCSEGKFRLLDTLDLAYNYFGTQASLEPLIDLPRILTVIIYGNPVLGSTGEDPTGIYVEELLDMAYAARDGYTSKPLDLITEIPKKRVLRKGGFVSGRHAMYKEFSVVHVDNEMESLKKTSYEYKQEGNQTLFAQAVNLAKKNNLSSTGSALQLPEYDFSSNTFMTGVGLVSNLPAGSGASIAGASATGTFNGNMSINSSVLANQEGNRERIVADNVMKEVAKEMNLLDLRDIEKLRRKLNREEEPIDQGTIPIDIFDRSITEPNPLKTYPVALNTALKSLRYAIEHPLTDHNSIPSHLLHSSQHHIKSTIASEKRQMPRRTADGQVIPIPTVEKRQKSPNKILSTSSAPHEKKKIEELKTDPSLISITNNNKPPPPSVFKQSMTIKQRQSTVQTRQQVNKQLRNTTLQQIEEVLDGLNKNTNDMISRNIVNQNNPDSVLVKGVARPNTGVKGLIDMVNNVVFDLQS